MIDCHTHAFPPLSIHLAKLPLPLRLLCQAAAPLARRLPRSRAPTHPPRLDVTRLAAVRQRGLRPLWRGVELLGSLGLAPQILLHGTLDDLAASMDRHDIARAVVIAAPPTAPNEWLLEAVRDEPRFIPVATLPELPPSARFEAWADAFVGLARAGARGFKIHPNVDGLPADHAAYRALFDVARAERRFVIVHTGCFNVLGYKHQRPADAADFVDLYQDHPEVRVCLAHMNRDEPEAAFALMRRFDQLFTDISWQPAERVSEALRTVGASRIVFGSDWPLLHRELQGDSLAILRAAAAGAAFEQVAERSARALLGEA